MPDTDPDRTLAQVRTAAVRPPQLPARIHARLDLMHDGDERMDMPDAERDICRATNALRDVLNLCIDMRYGDGDAAARIPAVIASAVGVRVENDDPGVADSSE